MDPAEFQAATRRLHELSAKATSLKVRDIALLSGREGSVAAHSCRAVQLHAAVPLTELGTRQEYLVAMDQR